MARRKKTSVTHSSGWSGAFMVAGVVFALFSLYLFARRGYYNVYIINKVLGSTAAVLAGITLIMGPIARRTKDMISFLPLRKELGLLALWLALLHIITSVLFLPNKFPLSWYQKEWLPIAFGAAAILIWLGIAWLSHEKHIVRLGPRLWRQYQSWGGRIAFLLIFFHLVVMKWPGWLRWWNGQVKTSSELTNPNYPPASLFVLAAMLLVVVIRTYNRFRKRKINRSLPS
jgi:sulfoxide reductase heme-binding subunit YedZ